MILRRVIYLFPELYDFLKDCNLGIYFKKHNVVIQKFKKVLLQVTEQFIDI